MPEGLGQDYFKFEIRLLKILGISFDEPTSRAYKIYSATSLICVPYFYTFLAASALFEETKFDSSYISLTYFLGLCIASVKLTFLVLKRKELAKIIDELLFLISTLNNSTIITHNIEMRSLTDCVNFNKNQKRAYWTLILPNLFYPIGISLFTRLRSEDYHDWELAFGSIGLIDTTKSPNFELVAAYQFLAIMINILCFAINDLIFAGLLSHLSFLFKILQGRLRFIAEISEANSHENSTDSFNYCNRNQFKRAIRDIVTLHLQILDLTKKVKKVYSILLLFICMTNILTLCFVLYMIVTLEGNRRITAFVGIVAICCQLLFICYWCDNLTVQSGDLLNAAYSTNFIGTPLEFQKDLIFIMRRSLQPDVIKAENFFGIRLMTFLKMFQAGYSYFIVVRKKL